jgi:predicted phage terminase large subunit-like protein
MTETLADLLGADDYEELQLKRVVHKADRGEFFVDLHPWLKKTTPEFNWDWLYMRYMVDLLQRLVEGDIRKLMISLPPRSGKSELCSIHLPAYFLEKNATNRVIIGTYNQTLANKFSRRIRSMCRGTVPLDPDRKAMEEWNTKSGGGVRAVGVGAGIAGVGANLIVLDDIVRSRKDANSITVRNSTFSWYTDDIYTRLEPDARILVLGTRWHEDDIIGRIERSEDSHEWTIVNFPAIAEDHDMLGRKPGEALNPERYPLEKLLDIKRVLGRSFNALYQGRPTEQEGETFKASWFRNHVVQRIPVSIQNKQRWEFVRYWDLAATQAGGDFTAGVLMAKEKYTKTFYVLDCVLGQWSTDNRNRVMMETAARDRVMYGEIGPIRIFFEQEPGSAGKDVAKHIVRMMAGFSVKAIKTTGSKEVRAEPYSAQLEAGSIYIIRNANWVEGFIDEHCIFPNGRHDDQVDAASGAFNQLAKGASFISIGAGLLG